MSWHALAWATTLPANDRVHESAMRTLAYLALRANDEGVCWPSVATVARDRGLSRAQIFEHFRLLSSAGLIVREERPGSQVKACRLVIHPSDVPDGLSVDQSGSPDGSRPVHKTPPVRSEATQEKTSEETTEGDVRAMPSESQADLGGSTYDPTPEEILARSYPDQCAKHQSRKNADPHFEPCGGCQRAAKELPEVQARMRRHRRDQEIQAQREEAQREAQAIAACSMCDKRGRLPNGGLCLHDPDAAEASHRGYLRALEAVRAARSAA